MVVQSFVLILCICVYFKCNAFASVHIEDASSFNSLWNICMIITWFTWTLNWKTSW